ncbi:MAG: hypothetical protein AB7E24_24735 [Novosphingobium sp.]
MADITITPANVLAGAGSAQSLATAGATITAGQVLYHDAADGKAKLADNNGATAIIRKVRGIALNGASNGQPVMILTEGDITLGAVLTAGVTYYLSDTPGGICPAGDLTTGEYPTILGVAKSTTVLSVKLHAAGVALA